jgi:hypothetical protein
MPQTNINFILIYFNLGATFLDFGATAPPHFLNFGLGDIAVD